MITNLPAARRAIFLVDKNIYSKFRRRRRPTAVGARQGAIFCSFFDFVSSPNSAFGELSSSSKDFPLLSFHFPPSNSLHCNNLIMQHPMEGEDRMALKDLHHLEPLANYEDPKPRKERRRSSCYAGLSAIKEMSPERQKAQHRSSLSSICSLRQPHMYRAPIIPPVRRQSIANGKYKYQGPLPESLTKKNDPKKMQRRCSVGAYYNNYSSQISESPPKRMPVTDSDSSEEEKSDVEDAMDSSSRSYTDDICGGAFMALDLDRARMERTRVCRRHSIATSSF